MTKAKPINFRPSNQDQFLVEKLMEFYDTDSKSKVLRHAIFQLSENTFGREETAKLLMEYNSQAYGGPQ